MPKHINLDAHWPTLNADALSSEIGLAIAAAIEKHLKPFRAQEAHVGVPPSARTRADELSWRATIKLRNGDILQLSEE
jgi:hypothetical protein